MYQQWVVSTTVPTMGNDGADLFPELAWGWGEEMSWWRGERERESPFFLFTLLFILY